MFKNSEKHWFQIQETQRWTPRNPHRKKEHCGLEFQKSVMFSIQPKDGPVGSFKVPSGKRRGWGLTAGSAKASFTSENE
jgi:hypothetical protein